MFDQTSTSTTPSPHINRRQHSNINIFTNDTLLPTSANVNVDLDVNVDVKVHVEPITLKSLDNRALDFGKLAKDYKIDSTFYSASAQAAACVELDDIVTKTNELIAATIASDRSFAKQYMQSMRIQDYSSSVLTNTHLLWNLRNISAFVLNSPLLDTPHYQDDINHFRQDLNLIFNFYRTLVNDLLFQLCFVAQSTTHSHWRVNQSLSHNSLPLFQYSKITISSTIKVITELKRQFEHLENIILLASPTSVSSMSSGSSATSTPDQQHQQQNQRQSLLSTFQSMLENNTIFLNHYSDLDKYIKSSILQRFTYNALSSYTKKVRGTIINDKLFQMVIGLERKEYLFIWMISCSNNSKQYYLNTCNPAAFNMSFISKAPILPTLMTILNEILKKIELYKKVETKKSIKAYNAIVDINVPSVFEFMEKKLTKVKAMYDSLNDKTLQAITMCTTTPTPTLTAKDTSIKPDNLIKHIIKLTTLWNKTMQSFSSIFSPSCPKILTRKPIANNWHASAYLMTMYCGITSILPGQPRLFERMTGTLPFFFESIMFINYEFCFSKLARQHRIYDQFAQSVRDMNEQERRHILERLWDDCFIMGGVLFCSSERILRMDIGHLNYLFSIKIGDDKYFLVGDPEIKNFKLFTLDAFINVILQRVFYFAGPKAE
ncbi:hypothetical protein SAMD00019534_008770 [Acytostelium subglobosum LB1]|uniref:hypothetical protein n=1 Tax=Acytostelium subglobosum LB1 TaxID=1410327 RepID=UPI0006451280|nr:hypothetical protein SAMD00019534_008770 [Acytostelium subglobosum LB1]GAM17702.1 hypothetical protein SAMD00019534_008770 [Acytostelium subglobosum LB1]|eukprot:XP_012758298.1 hypothetical protein SAMD00019534_008770 [Acytostelium subglobosum LB1]